MFMTVTKEMINFIENNPTAFHVVDSICNQLQKQGFERLYESNRWDIEKGGKYFVSRNGSSIIAFCVGKNIDDYSFNIIASHTDSPTFKIKENAELHVRNKYTKLNTEGYGGMICSTWLDRPLSVAGRILVRDSDNLIRTCLINVDRDLLVIPNVAIHMNRKINEGFEFNKQIDMLPLFCEGSEENGFMKMIASERSVDVNDIVGSDLYLYSRARASIWGKNNEFISCGRLDDQQCVFSSMKALIESDNSETINVMACFDNEEVGSSSKQGADSSFLYDVLKRVNGALGMNEEDYQKALAEGFMISADNAHAVHPNHPEYTDENNCNYMNEGIVVKSNAAQKYTSDGVSIGIVRELARRAEVPIQYFANRSDKAGGSTLGNISQSHVSIKCVDVGVPQLAMHSSYETAGVKDTLYMIKLMKELYCSRLCEKEDGIICIEK